MYMSFNLFRIFFYVFLPTGKNLSVKYHINATNKIEEIGILILIYNERSPNWYLNHLLGETKAKARVCGQKRGRKYSKNRRKLK